MNKLRDHLTSPSNMRVHMTANMKKLTQEVPEPQAPWKQHFISKESKTDAKW